MPPASKREMKRPDRKKQIEAFYEDGAQGSDSVPNFVQHATAHPRGKMRPVTPERLRQKAADKRDLTKARLTTQQAVAEASAEKDRAWQLILREECAAHGLDAKKFARYIRATGGGAHEHWTLGRELDHRLEFGFNKVQTHSNRAAKASLQADDPFLPVLHTGLDKTPAEFLSDPAVAWTRLASRSGSSGYTTQKRLDQVAAWEREGVPEAERPPILVFGRVAMTAAEQKRFVAAQEAAVLQGEEPPTKASFMPPRAWVPIPAADLAKISRAVEAFTEYWEHSKRIKRRTDGAVQTMDQAVREALGTSAVPDAKATRTDARLKMARTDDVVVSLPALVSSASESVDLMQDEFSTLRSTWKLLGTIATEGQFVGSIDVLYAIITGLLQSEACVVRCDYTYEPPNGNTFRTFDETVSYVPPGLEDAVEHLKDATHGKATTVNGKPRRVYVHGATTFYTAPYAAMWDAQRCIMHCSFTTLHAHYPELYATVRRALTDWHSALLTENGGIGSLEAVKTRMHLEGDVLGPGTGYAIAERPPWVSTSRVGAWPEDTRTRVRPRRMGDLEDDGGTLPDTGYDLVAEYDIGAGWMVWTDQRLYKQDTYGAWTAMPVDATGRTRDLGWMEGELLVEGE